MKCLTCDNRILLHSSVLEIPCRKNSEPLSYIGNKGMIYSKYGLIQFIENNICEVCTDENILSADSLTAFRLSLIRKRGLICTRKDMKL